LDCPYTAKVNQARLDRKLTQHEFGALFGVGRQTVEQWEKGKTHVTRKMRGRLKVKGIV
jgi:DNA-binding transcriptional regulator YiaG